MTENYVNKEFLYGCAFGDSWGLVTEFLPWPMIEEDRPYWPKELKVSDDTQMSLYSAKALMKFIDYTSYKYFERNTSDVFSAFNFYSENVSSLETDESILFKKLIRSLRLFFAEMFLVYKDDPDNDRYPGKTVMGSLSKYLSIRDKYIKHGLEGFLEGNEGALAIDSDIPDKNTGLGSGAAMRAPIIGSFQDFSEKSAFLIAVISSEVTHKNSLASFVSGITAVSLRRILETGNVISIGDIESYRDYYNSYLKVIAQKEDRLINEGNEKYKNIVGKIVNIENFIKSDDSEDICLYSGDGWTSDEAFISAYYSFVKYKDRPFEGTKRLVHSSGDSDTIAAIGSSFLGAYLDYRLRNGESTNFLYSSFKDSLEPRYQKEIASVVEKINLFNFSLKVIDSDIDNGI